MKKYFIFFFMLVYLFTSGQPNSSSEKKAAKLFEQAKTAYDSKLLNKSLNLIDEALSADSSFLDAYLLKSDIYQDLDSVQLHIKAVEAALKLAPDKNVKLYYLLGKAYYRSGRYQNANDAFKNYLQRVNDSAPFVANARQSIVKCQGAVNLLKLD